MATLIAALNITYEEREERPFWQRQALTLALTAGAVSFGTAALALVALLPATVDRLPISSAGKTALAITRWPLLALLMAGALAALYRYAPSRCTPGWRWVSRGAMLATLLWLLGSWAFSYYIAHMSADTAGWGALGAVLILQTWFYLTAFIVVLGAKLNAEAERRTPREHR